MEARRPDAPGPDGLDDSIDLSALDGVIDDDEQAAEDLAKLLAEDEDAPTDFEGSEFLLGRSPREVLRKLHRGDPLDLWSRTRKRLLERAYLVDHGRLHLRTLARTAFEAMSYRGEPPLEAWLTGCIDGSLRDLMQEDHEEQGAGEPLDPRFATFYEHIAKAVGAEPARGRAMCIVFNTLPIAVRRDFFAVVLGGTRIEDHVAASEGTSVEEVQAHVRQALDEMLTLKSYPALDPFEDWS